MINPQKSAMDAYLSELSGVLAERQKLDRRISKSGTRDEQAIVR
jgi:pyridoxine/pyridoxamine 5'-phosphate oxidase